MDKKTITGIAVGGLLHDIGKFAERSSLYAKGDEKEVNEKFKYGHSFHTYQVLEEFFPESAAKEISHDLMGTSSLRDLAAQHHKPDNKIQAFIQIADWHAAGHERQPSDTDAKQYAMAGRSTKDQQPLISILSRINLPELKSTPSGQDMYYRIQVPSLEQDITPNDMHPCSEKEFPAVDVQAAYKTHWHNFVQTIRPTPGTSSPLDLIDNFDTILEICRLYQWCLPETTRRQDLSDVSLFEHQKATAAIASAAFLYLEEKARMTGKISKEEILYRPKEKRFVLFCGDISGIQQFVYQISSKGAYKMLKGRSFFIQLLAEILARKYLEKFGLTSANILFCSGGKFYLLLPNLKSTAQQIKTLTASINGELFDSFKGDLYLRTGSEQLSGHDLTMQKGRSLSVIWDELALQVAIDDKQRYAEIATKGYERIFGTDPCVQTNACAVCHCSMKANGDEKQESICHTCLVMKEIGQKLKTARYIVVSDTAEAQTKNHTMAMFGKYLWFCDEKPKLSIEGCFVWSLNSADFIELVVKSKASGLHLNGAPFIVGGNHIFDREEIDLQFDDIAQKGEGVHSLGVLRMDVDNLGRIFREGLNNYRHGKEYDDYRFHSMARITTLSWQLAYFFGSMVPQSMNSDPDWQGKSTVVYAGGDDLFALGAWHSMPKIALALKQQFARFCCHNPVFSLSGGMVVTDGKFPIYKSAEMAGDAQSLAKGNRTCFSNNSGKTAVKESFTFFDATMHWSEFSAIAEVRSMMRPLLLQNENRPLLGRLRNIYASWEKSRMELLRAGQPMNLDHVRQRLAAEKWRWRMVYSLARFAESKPALRETIEALQRFIVDPVAETDRSGIELLGVLSKWCELQLRSADNRKEKNNDNRG